MNIVITGSIAFDYLMSFPGDFMEHIKPDKLNKLSLSFLVDEMRKQYGGCAPNIAFTLALLGERPVVMGTAGQDFGDYRAWLEAHGVDTSGVRVIPDVFTASFFVSTDRRQNQIASFYTGAMAYARELSFHEMTMPVDITIISPNDPLAMQKYPAECKALGIPYIYDPSQQIVRLDGAALREGVEGADILIVNDYEYELLKDRTGMNDADICATVKRAVIITRGEKGSRIWAGGEEIVVPVVPPQQVLDPTGVGDAYRAGLIKGLALGLPWRICGQIGALAATYVLETHGPQAHSYTLAAFGERYKTVFGEDAFTGIMSV
ncbi:MAG TPA: carbohydrate kinase family protein [Anaerolineae bacterium]|nr:carbohydrate kinase family protein [Anaerolineae bacterium]HQI83083.1 carbohydrate kinase family protein [Anaerolineae bacterium]